VNLDYKYWTFDNVVSDETRNRILTGLQDKPFKEGLVINKDGAGEEDKKSRDNSVAFLGGQFARDIFIPYIKGANKSSGWNYDIDWFEDIQVSKYGVDKHYAWHHDAMGYPEGVGHKNYEGRERKLTAITLLSDDFSGGEFELSHQIIGDNNDTEIEVLPVDLSLGTILVFPSFLWHRVKPVTSGIRHSMQVWCLGPRFK
jgi:PKHD-type hydroxylase